MSEQGKTKQRDEHDSQEPDEPSRVAVAAEKAKVTAQKVTQLFPVRVWQRFSARNGQILAAGVSYQALFALFAALYVTFAGIGLWLGGRRDVIERMIDAINSYLPGVIGDDGALVKRDAVIQVAQDSGATLSISGLIALGVLLFTAVGWIGSIRTSVRDIFGLAPEKGNAVLLKVRDLAAAAALAILLLLGSALGFIASSAVSWIFSLLGWTSTSWIANLSGGVISAAAVFAVNTVTLILLFRFMTGTNLRAADVRTGSLLGAAGMTVLQLGFGFLVGRAPNNPLLVTFAVLIGLLLWIRLVMMVILIAAAWVAEAAHANDIQLESLDPEQQALHEARVLVEAAEVEKARAEKALEEASWIVRAGARRRLSKAESALEERRSALSDLDPTGRTTPV